MVTILAICGAATLKLILAAYTINQSRVRWTAIYSVLPLPLHPYSSICNLSRSFICLYAMEYIELCHLTAG